MCQDSGKIFSLNLVRHLLAEVQTPVRLVDYALHIIRENIHRIDILLKQVISHRNNAVLMALVEESSDANPVGILHHSVPDLAVCLTVVIIAEL